MNVLHIDASARPRSISRRVSAAVVSSLREHGPVDLVHRDLATMPVPHIGAAWTEICDTVLRERIVALDAYVEAVRTPAQREAWSVVEPLLHEVVDADVIVLATPMYNYSVPSSLKAWIDQVTFPRMDLSPRRFVVVAARGGAYGEGAPKAAVEHQVRYLSDFLPGHFGVAPPACLVVELGNATVDPLLSHLGERHEESLASALAEARTVAARLWGEEVQR